MTIVRAVYRDQVLRLDVPLPIAEGSVVEVSLDLPASETKLRKRFTWEDGPVLPGDGSSSLTNELRRQRDGE